MARAVPPDHNAAMTRRTWLPDPSHYPEQMTPLSATVWFEAVGLGLHAAARELRAPFGGFEARTEGGWAYEAELDPDWRPDADVMRSAALAVATRWDEELRERVWQITRELWQLRPELPPPDEAVTMLDRTWELVREQWTLHFLVVLPAQAAAEIFNERYVELHGSGDPLAAYRLLEAPRPEHELVLLARQAKEHRLDHLIRDLPVEHALARLRGLALGRAWLRRLDGYLDPLGGMGGRARWHELSLPREAELPEMTLAAIRLYLDHEPPEPRAREPVPADLEEIHAACAAAFALKETHTYDIDYPGLLATREVLIGFGRRLAAEGLLDEAADVWFLTREELRTALAEPGDPRAAVSTHRAEAARGLVQGPAPYLGDAPAAGRQRDATLEKFYGAGGRALAGAGASPGIAEGPARIVARPEDFARVEPGDVLVAATTTPAWTPLFGSVAALVTETGGVLSHAAVVAREYRIPAVVGATGATTAIPEGARVRVDGGTGEVTLI
ncbi:MAG: rifampicin phosphotransferase [Gaiellaceae bacterium]|nr:rifampicin phosphotransferase [Gaiellaceae bacterium]